MRCSRKKSCKISKKAKARILVACWIYLVQAEKDAGKSWINGLSNSGVELGGETKKQEQRSGQAKSVCPRVSKPTIDWLASEVLNMKDKRRLLPIVKLYGSDYFVDIPNRQFKKFRGPENTIWFYSEQGRRMVKECAAKENWDSHGVDGSK